MLTQLCLPCSCGSFSYPIGIGKKPADDLAPGSSGDLSKRDPLPGSFWKRPDSVATEDLYNGFGRAALPSFAGETVPITTRRRRRPG